MNTSKKTPVRKAVPAVAGEVDTGATHVVLTTPKREQKAFFEFEFSESASSQAADGSFVSGEKKMSAKLDSTSLTEAAQRLETLVPQVLTSLSPEQFDEGIRRAVAVRSFLLESFQLAVDTVVEAKTKVEAADHKFQWEQADHEKQLEAEFPGWKAKFEGRVVREDDEDDASEELLDKMKADSRVHLKAVSIALKSKGWEDAQLLQLDEQLEGCDTVEEFLAFGEALTETLKEELGTEH